MTAHTNRETSSPASTNEFQQMTLQDIALAYDGLQAAISGVRSVYNQPRCNINSRGGAWLSNLFGEDLVERLENAVVEAKNRHPINETEHKAKVHIMLSNAVERCAEVSEIAEFADSLR